MAIDMKVTDGVPVVHTDCDCEFCQLVHFSLQPDGTARLHIGDQSIDIPPQALGALAEESDFIFRLVVHAEETLGLIEAATGIPQAEEEDPSDAILEALVGRLQEFIDMDNDELQQKDPLGGFRPTLGRA